MNARWLQTTAPELSKAGVSLAACPAFLVDWASCHAHSAVWDACHQLAPAARFRVGDSDIAKFYLQNMRRIADKT